VAMTLFDGGSLPKHTQFGWALDIKDRAHCRFGKAFVLVTPSANHTFVEDATMSNTILFQRKEFSDPLKLAGM